MKSRRIAVSALFTALMCLCAWISIPFGDMTFSMQTFALFLTLLLLDGNGGSLVVFVYLLLGAAGVPVFTGFRGGLGVLLGATGGYVLGFLAAALLYWAVTAALGSRYSIRMLALVLGLAGCYVFGTLWFVHVYLGSGNTLGLGAVLLKCVVPYLLPDGLKLVLALSLSRQLKRHVSK